MKKSFILHIDSLGILNELTDEQAGQLFKLIADYHNPKEPKITEITQVVNLAFYSFRSQFERDSQKYESIVERNKTNGALGGRPKKKTQKNPKKADSDSNNDSDSDSDSNNDSKKNKYGKNSNIHLSESEYLKLIQDYSKEKADKAIDYLSDYAIEKPTKFKEYKNHNLTLRRWVFDAIGKNQGSENKTLSASESHIESWYIKSKAMVDKNDRTAKEHNQLVKQNSYNSKYLLPE
jgi:hypothetical protein